jgi:hypothetical protein
MHFTKGWWFLRSTGPGSFVFAVNSPWIITGTFDSNNKFTTGDYPCFASMTLPCQSTFGGSITSLTMKADNGTQTLQFVGTVTGTVSGGESYDHIEFDASEFDDFSFFGRWSNGWYTSGQYLLSTSLPPQAAGTLIITTATTPIPEPSTIALLAPGLLALGALRHKTPRLKRGGPHCEVARLSDFTFNRCVRQITDKRSHAEICAA